MSFQTKKKIGWTIGFGLIFVAAILGIAEQTLWQFLSGGISLVILGMMFFFEDREDMPMFILVFAGLTIIAGINVIAGALGGAF